MCTPHIINHTHSFVLGFASFARTLSAWY